MFYFLKDFASTYKPNQPLQDQDLQVGCWTSANPGGPMVGTGYLPIKLGFPVTAVVVQRRRWREPWKGGTAVTIYAGGNPTYKGTQSRKISYLSTSLTIHH